MIPQRLDLRQLVYNASTINLREFVQLVCNVVELLRKEDGLVGSQRIIGRSVEVPPIGEATIVGDLHGDLDSLTQILESSHFLDKVRSGRQSLLFFLGDYGDRGVYSPEVYYIVLKLKETFPENVVLMRGNHEGPDDILASPHDLPEYLQNRFGRDWSTAYLKLKQLFSWLYNAVIVRERFVMLHGGVPSRAKSVDDMAYAHLKHPKESHLEEILWSDPEEDLKGTFPSPRGAGRLFGADVSTNFLEMLKIDVLIRGHEPADEGFRINHNGRVLTLFSRKGEPYFNTKAAYLQLDLSNKITDAFQLQQFLKLF